MPTKIVAALLAFGALDTMIVTAKSMTARMNEFESRRKVGVGYFITADDLEK